MHAMQQPVMRGHPLAERLQQGAQQAGAGQQGQDPRSPTARAQQWHHHPRDFCPHRPGSQVVRGEIWLVQREQSPVLSLRVGEVASDTAVARMLRDEVLAAVAAALDPGQPRPGARGQGTEARVQVRLDPNQRGYGEACALLRNGGSVTIQTSVGTHVVPVRAEPLASYLHGTVQLMIREIPVEWSEDSLAAQLMCWAGYRTVQGPARLAPQPGAVQILRVSLGRLRADLGGHPNASVMLVDLVPPADDPHLRQLPYFLPLQSGERMYCQLRDDPLRRAAPARPPGTTAPRAPSIVREVRDMTCACCRIEMQHGGRDQIMVTQCNHVFHCFCMHRWALAQQNVGRPFTCPTCRAVLGDRWGPPGVQPTGWVGAWPPGNTNPHPPPTDTEEEGVAQLPVHPAAVPAPPPPPPPPPLPPLPLPLVLPMLQMRMTRATRRTSAPTPSSSGWRSRP